MNVYLIGAEGTNKYKIGITSKNPKERVKELQIGNGEKLFLVHKFATKFNFSLESTLHRHYKSKKTIREWFEFTEEDVVQFLEICNKYENNLQILKESNTYYQDKNMY